MCANRASNEETRRPSDTAKTLLLGSAVGLPLLRLQTLTHDEADDDEHCHLEVVDDGQRFDNLLRVAATTPRHYVLLLLALRQVAQHLVLTARKYFFHHLIRYMVRVPILNL